MEVEKIDWLVCGSEWETIQVVGNGTQHLNAMAMTNGKQLTLQITCPNPTMQNWTYDVPNGGLIFYIPSAGNSIRVSTYTKM